MVIIAHPYTIYTFQVTATSDAKFKLVNRSFWVREANIHVTNNNAMYGDINTQNALLTTNDVLTFEDFDLNDLYFKNANAGDNTTITCVAVKMSKARMRDLGVSEE